MPKGKGYPKTAAKPAKRRPVPAPKRRPLKANARDYVRLLGPLVRRYVK